MPLIFFNYDDPRLMNTERKAESFAGISNPLYGGEKKKKKKGAEVQRRM